MKQIITPAPAVSAVSHQRIELPTPVRRQVEVPKPPGVPSQARPVANPQMSQQAKVAQPQPSPKTVAETSPEYESLVPPSQFYFYSFKELGARQLKAIHQARFNAAVARESPRITVETISSLLTQSAFDLTVPDFYWVMYHLRQTSSLKSQFTHNAICTNLDHIDAVNEGKKDRKTLYNLEVISKTRLKETPFDIKKFEAWQVPECLVNLPLGVATARDLVDIHEAKDRDDYAEFLYLAEIATCLSPLDDRGIKLPLAKRVELAGELTAEQNEALRTYSDFTTNYGVEETIHTTCKECGAGIESIVSISAHTFL